MFSCMINLKHVSDCSSFNLSRGMEKVSDDHDICSSEISYCHNMLITVLDLICQKVWRRYVMNTTFAVQKYINVATG